MEKAQLAERLRNIRLLRGFSVNQVAKLVGKAPNTIINWESGKVSPDIDVVQQLCQIYKIRPNEMFGWDPCPELEAFMEEKQEIINELHDLKRQKTLIELKIKKLEFALRRRTIVKETDNDNRED